MPVTSTPAQPELLLVLHCAEGNVQMLLGVAPEAGKPEPNGRQRASSLQGLLCAEEWRLPSQSVELLMPLLAAALETVKLAPHNIRRIACVTGPGSFTGIRLSISTAAGLARATGATTAAIPFLPLLAENVLQSGLPSLAKATNLWAITHARRDLVHVQGFSITTPTQYLTPLDEVMVLSPVQAASRIAQTGQRSLLFGSGATRNRQIFEYALATAAHCTLLPGIMFDSPHANTLFAAACRASFSTGDISPQYARPCDAEESLDQIASSLGLNPQTARSVLQSLQADCLPTTP